MNNKKAHILYISDLDPIHINYVKNRIMNSDIVSSDFKHGDSKHGEKISDFLHKWKDELPSCYILIDSKIQNDIFFSCVRTKVLEYPEVNFLFLGQLSEKNRIFFIDLEEKIHEFLEKNNNVSIERVLCFLKYYLENTIISYTQKDIADLVKGFFFDEEIYNGESDSIEFLKGLYVSLLKYQAKPSLVPTLICIPQLPDVISIINKRNLSNIFDASNLRYVAKQFLFSDLMVTRNYRSITDSRSNNLAFCVDEETSMTYTMGYSLYSNGYRSLPVSSYDRLMECNNSLFKANINKVVLRDFDLQFPDAECNKIDLVRGFKKNINGWNDLRHDNCNTFWNNISDDRVYFISQGFEDIDLQKNGESKLPCRKLMLPGIKKPLVGIYFSLHNGIEEVLTTFNQLRQIKEDEYKMVNSRIGHDHSIPLNLYNLALPLIERAKYYYIREEYIFSAVLSQEAIEILNGFHIALTLEALLIHAKAENALAMNILGCDEQKLAEDSKIRIKVLIADVERLTCGSYVGKRNVLNQIFSDCRQYCHEKEHFQSEEIFIDAMAKLNDGGPYPLFKKFKSMFKDLYQ